MNRPLVLALAITDTLFLAYWALSALVVIGVAHLPTAWMYEGYDQPQTVAWNWSFFPLDLAFSVLGLSAVQKARRNDPMWRPLALMSLVFTMTAGGMAVGYWTILRQFDPSWYLPNLALLIWPLFFLPKLLQEMGGPH